jgi:two-component system chemotaxis response regulator CheY
METYSIGKLSKIAGISTDALRHYDAIGLLKPAFTSPETGYRYYTPKQAEDLARILELKTFGFPLADIKGILDRVDTPTLGVIYRRQYGELLLENHRITNAMEALAQKIKSHEEVFPMSKKILLVDDAAFLRMMCKDVLQKNGFEVAGEADNGEKGVEMYKQIKPDLTLLNVTMPLMDGIAALKKIREYDPQARVVMLTAMGQSTIVAEALLTGARRFVVKPFKSDKLMEEVRFTLFEESPMPFNAELLTKLLNYAHNNRQNTPGGDILAQWQIDKIIRIAEAPSASEEEINDLMHHLFMAAHDMPPRDMPQDAPSRDPVLVALEKLAEEKKKMMGLLEKLLEAQVN